jgi:hypothetical protein
MIFYTILYKSYIMINNKRMPGGAGTLLAAGLAAFAYYKYSKMSDEQKQNLVGDLKEKAQNLYDQYMPAEIKDFFAKKGPQNAESRFGEGSSYSS